MMHMEVILAMMQPSFPKHPDERAIHVNAAPVNRVALLQAFVITACMAHTTSAVHSHMHTTQTTVESR